MLTVIKLAIITSQRDLSLWAVLSANENEGQPWLRKVAADGVGPHFPPRPRQRHSDSCVSSSSYVVGFPGASYYFRQKESYDLAAC